jgi:Zn-dependent protease with chaperone function
VKLNIRVASLIFGFTAIFFLGRWALNSAFYGRDRDFRAKLIKIGLGIGIIAVGLITVFFGRVLQAAMSRQREYLADASAIQFTRHPDGLISAFNKLSKNSELSTKIDSDNTSEFSHAFIFGIGGELMATHPPLEERIKRIKE